MLRNEEESGWVAADILCVCMYYKTERVRERARGQSYILPTLLDKLQGVGLNTNWVRASALSNIYITSMV